MATIREYEGTRVLVVGMARSGIAAALLLYHLGARVTVTDRSPAEKLSFGLAAFPGDIVKILGTHDGVDPASFDLAVVSPGVPWETPLLEELRGVGVTVISEFELAASRIAAPIIAITGSNGKSTTTALIGAILEEAGHKTFVGGNIGSPLCGAADGDHAFVVAEVSSFQLEGVAQFCPKVALILNITPDHIDRHGSFERYAALKKRIYENQGSGDTLIVNGLDPEASAVTPPKDVAAIAYATPGKGGVWAEGDRAVAIFNSAEAEIFSRSDLPLEGVANFENAMAAATACLTVGVQPETIRAAIKKFAGLPHRMERVAVIDGVTYINDSKGTNVDATVRSLAGFVRNVALIAGGSSKGADFAPLAEAVRIHAKGAALIGETGPAIAAALGDFTPMTLAGSLPDAVSAARSWVKEGETVLFSPACASFDMFSNFEERGDAFRAAVLKLAKGGGAHAG